MPWPSCAEQYVNLDKNARFQLAADRPLFELDETRYCGARRVLDRYRDNLKLARDAAAKHQSIEAARELGVPIGDMAAAAAESVRYDGAGKLLDALMRMRVATSSELRGRVSLDADSGTVKVTIQVARGRNVEDLELFAIDYEWCLRAFSRLAEVAHAERVVEDDVSRLASELLLRVNMLRIAPPE